MKGKAMAEMRKSLDKGDMVLGIIEIFDIAERAIQENNELRREREDMRRLSKAAGREDSALTATDMTIFTIGKKTVYEDSVYSWNKASATKDEETGMISVTTFEKWRKGKVSDPPSYMSLDDFYAYFDAELRSDYEREKTEAIDKLKTEEVE